MAVYGPGDTALDHRPNEHIGLDELDRAVRVLARVVADLPARLRPAANDHAPGEY